MRCYADVCVPVWVCVWACGGIRVFVRVYVHVWAGMMGERDEGTSRALVDVLKCLLGWISSLDAVSVGNIFAGQCVSVVMKVEGE